MLGRCFRCGAVDLLLLVCGMRGHGGMYDFSLMFRMWLPLVCGMWGHGKKYDLFPLLVWISRQGMKYDLLPLVCLDLGTWEEVRLAAAIDLEFDVLLLFLLGCGVVLGGSKIVIHIKATRILSYKQNGNSLSLMLSYLLGSSLVQLMETWLLQATP